MLRGTAVAAALAIAAVAAAQSPAALAEAPKCTNKANKHVACTDKLKAKTPRRRGGDVDGRDFLIWKRAN